MKSIMKLCCFVFLAFAVACGGEECQECTGMNNNGEEGDFTICNNDDGTTTRTNNLLGTEVTDSVNYLEGVVFFESLGLECN